MSAETQPADALDIALRVAKAIEAVEGRYFIGGSLASSVQGEPRSTNDIDIVVDMPLGRVAAFVKGLGDDFEADVILGRESASIQLDETLFGATSCVGRGGRENAKSPAVVVRLVRADGERHGERRVGR